MTYTGVSKSLQGGLTQKQYSYSPLNALVNIIFNTAGQIVQATVARQLEEVAVQALLVPSFLPAQPLQDDERRGLKTCCKNFYLSIWRAIANKN